MIRHPAEAISIQRKTPAPSREERFDAQSEPKANSVRSVP